MKPQILLTNDDGIQSPGLWSAAETLSEIGFVHVIAPREQWSGAGRSLPISSDGIILPQQINVHGKEWTVYSVGGTPAQAVLHAVLEILPERPHLVVSGINYGENLSVDITTSGTVGAALEGASLGIPSLAVSLETSQEHHYSYSKEVDFAAAAFFTAFFGRLLLEKQLPPDVNVLKIDVPSGATPETPWEITHLYHDHYFEPLPPQRKSWDAPGSLGYRVIGDPRADAPHSDAYVVRVKKQVSVTPLSLDLTSRIPPEDLDRLLRAQK